MGKRVKGCGRSDGSCDPKFLKKGVANGLCRRKKKKKSVFDVALLECRSLEAKSRIRKCLGERAI